MNKFKIGDWLECVDAGLHGGVELTNGRLYQIRDMDTYTIKVINDEGSLLAYYGSRFKLYQTREDNMSTKVVVGCIEEVLEEQYIKEFLKKLEYVLWNDNTVFQALVCRADELVLDSNISTIYGVDDIYTYINNSYDQLTSQAAQKRKQELLDKKARLDVELAQINKELEGL